MLKFKLLEKLIYIKFVFLAITYDAIIVASKKKRFKYILVV